MASFTYTLNAAMPDACRGGVLTIGNFDGVHVGHQSLVEEAAKQARAAACPPIAVTFDPHPLQLLRPDLVGPSITTLEDRAALLHQHGVDHVLIVQTSPALLQLSAREFFEQIIVGELQAKALVEGFNFGFGKGREGTIDVLKQLCTAKRVRLTLMPAREMLGQPVSSGRIRSELLAGNVDVAAEMLGRPYRITGLVGVGQKRGATLGFPTANLRDIPTLLPGDAVYAVHATVDGKTWPAAANVGRNPTFAETARKVEVHLIGFVGDIYDKSLGVDFLKKIRDTKPFGSPQELIAQIQRDIADAMTLLR